MSFKSGERTKGAFHKDGADCWVLPNLLERTGRTLQSLIPLDSLRRGASSGMEQKCKLCYQGTEIVAEFGI